MKGRGPVQRDTVEASPTARNVKQEQLSEHLDPATRRPIDWAYFKRSPSSAPRLGDRPRLANGRWPLGE